MKRSTGLAIMAVVPLLMAAMWMDQQPSIKPYQAPILMPPGDSVPVSGRELVSQDTELKNPVSPNAESLAQGEGALHRQLRHVPRPDIGRARSGRQKTRPSASRP